MSESTSANMQHPPAADPFAPSTTTTTRPFTDSIEIAGGAGAPERARREVLSHLDADGWGPRASDAALLVSELVTNSVIHANVGIQEALLLELTILGDRLRIAVIDCGSGLEPRILPPDPARAGGFGLRLVEQISSAWGVVRDAVGTTRVWCELPLVAAEDYSGLQPRSAD